MKKTIHIASVLAIAFAIHIQTASAQQGVSLNSGNTGVGIAGYVYKDLRGSAYLFDEWVKGNVELTDGKKYYNINLKYDLLRDELLFMNDGEDPQFFAKPVKQFLLTNAQNPVTARSYFRGGFKPIDGGNAKSFYEVLVDGKTTLLKRNSKKITEGKVDGSLIPTKYIEIDNRYYISSNDTDLVRIKADKRSVLAALKDKEAQVQEYIKANKLDLKNDADLVKLFTYYNGL